MQSALIHEFDGSTFDEEGDVLLGFYWQILDFENNILCGLMGPYGLRNEAENACQQAFESGNW